MKFTFQTLISASQNVVFSWLDKPEKAREWMSSVSDARILNETEDRVGTTFIEVVEENGRSTQLQGVISGYNPPEMIAFDLSGRYNHTHVVYLVRELEN